MRVPRSIQVCPPSLNLSAIKGMSRPNASTWPQRLTLPQCNHVRYWSTLPYRDTERRHQAPYVFLPIILISADIQYRSQPEGELASFNGLRVVMSTGAPFTAPLHAWTQEVFGPDVHVVSTSGGTDICASCKLANLLCCAFRPN